LDKINQYLSCYEIEEKYRDVAAFQWQMTVTREQKLHDRKLKAMEAERKRMRQERLARMKEERKQARI
jgi:hypothetical protein